MLKSVLIATAISMSASAVAELYPGAQITEIPSGLDGIYKFQVSGGEDGPQAAAYVYPNIAELYERASKDYAPLKALIEKIYADNGCDPNGRSSDPDFKDVFCGQINRADDSNTVLWSYGRGGWAGAGSQRKSFLTFTSAGSGGFTDAAIELTTDVSVNALNEPEGDQPVVFEVTVDMTSFKEIKRDDAN